MMGFVISNNQTQINKISNELTEKDETAFVDSLPESKATYDFEDKTPLFTIPVISTSAKGTSTVITDKDTTTGISNSYQSVKVSDDARIGTNSNVLSEFDFSDTTQNATSTTVEFDFQYVNNGRMRIALMDLDVQNTKSGNFRWDYDGIAVDIFSNSNNRIQVNEKSYTRTTFFGAWLHAKFIIDFATKTVEYSIVNDSDASNSISGTTDFHGDCTRVTGIAVYTWLAGDEMYIDNISIYSRIVPNENTWYIVETDNGTKVYRYSNNEAVEVVDDIKPYPLTLQKIGTWFNGQPIWRYCINYTFTDEDITSFDENNKFSTTTLFDNTKFWFENNTDLIFLNGSFFLAYDINDPNIVDDYRLTWDNIDNIRLNDEKYIDASILTLPFPAPGVYGFVDFVTPEDNIKTT